MININGPSRLTLSPDTLATVLDALAGFGPFARVKPAFDEILNQLKEINEHTNASGPDASPVGNDSNGGDGTVSDPGVGSNGPSPEVGDPSRRSGRRPRLAVHRANGSVAPGHSRSSANPGRSPKG